MHSVITRIAFALPVTAATLAAHDEHKRYALETSRGASVAPTHLAMQRLREGHAVAAGYRVEAWDYRHDMHVLELGNGGHDTMARGLVLWA